MDLLPSVASDAARLVGWVSLTLGVVVAAVVAWLLRLVHGAACDIEANVARIWTVGQRVAANTVHIPLLYRTNAVAGDLLAALPRIDSAAAAIESHTRNCPRCPSCLRHEGASS